MKCEINSKSEMKGAFFAILQHKIQFKQIKDCLVQITKSSFQLYLFSPLPLTHLTLKKLTKIRKAELAEQFSFQLSQPLCDLNILLR